MKTRKINIAIDGPSAAGKSSIAKAVAKKLGYVHLDTGAMYRCVAYKALQNDLDLKDEEGLVKMVKETEIRLCSDGVVLLDGQDVSLAIRSDAVSLAASSVSQHKQIRAILVKRQQEMAKEKGFIMDGRDITTVVLPDAEVKIFLTASSFARAKRRFSENQQKGIKSEDIETLAKQIEQRDYQDMHRKESPLTISKDATYLDTSALSFEEVVEKVFEIIEPKLIKEGV